MPKIPFSVYDFFAILAAGFLLCVAADYAFPGEWLLRDKLPLSFGVFWTIAAFIIGHVNASASSWLLERNIVGKLLGHPHTNLFGEPDWRRWLFPNYYTPMNAKVRDRVKAKANAKDGQLTGEALFHHVRTVAKNHAPTWEKMQIFLQLYGFCRNIAFALLVGAALMFWKSYPTLGVVAIFFAIGMFYRYLKFFRQYSFEMFTAYPDVSG